MCKINVNAAELKHWISCQLSLIKPTVVARCVPSGDANSIPNARTRSGASELIILSN